MKDKIFYAVCFGFVLGVLLGSLFRVNFFIIFFVGMIAFVSVIYFRFFSLGHSLTGEAKNNWGAVAGIFVLACSLGILRFDLADRSVLPVFDRLVGQKVEMRGEIIDQPDLRENNQKLIVETIDGKEKTRILLSVGLEEDYRYGDSIAFYGKLERPENFVTDYGKEFDYVNYLKKDGIFYAMYYPRVEIISHDNGNKIRATLFTIKDKFVEKINWTIRSPENLLIGGLILGEKSAFSNELRQSFINTGTIHIIALSGYNVTIVAEWIMKLFSFLPKNLGIGAGIFAILIFILMTGASSTAIRAGIMATLALIARATGRNYDVARALIIAGVLMILLNPYVLLFDVSFELSFIATIAVIFVAPKIEKYFQWVPEKFKLRDIISVTSAAYLFVLPFILYKMGTLSIVALPANALILPFIPLTMAFGFFTGGAGLIWYGLAVPFGFVSQLLLSYELFIINIFSNLPFSSLAIPNFPLLITVAIYVYFIYRLFGRNLKQFFTEPL